MTNQNEPDFSALENHIIDLIKEEQIKLGYNRETLRLYYQLDSLNNLLGCQLSVDNLKKTLDEFCLTRKTKLGSITHSNKDTRFCIIVPPEGVTYVHEKVEDNSFLMDLIEKVRSHTCSLEDLLEIFHRYSDCVKYEQVSHDEFDYIVYFENGIPDAYIYCINFEGNHATYHRFTRSDYQSFGFHEEVAL